VRPRGLSEGFPGKYLCLQFVKLGAGFLQSVQGTNSNIKILCCLLLTAGLSCLGGCANQPDPQVDDKKSSSLQQTEPTSASTDNPTCPGIIDISGAQLTIHAPQIRKWENFGQIEAIAAVEALAAGATQPEFGALEFRANTRTDLDRRVVSSVSAGDRCAVAVDRTFDEHSGRTGSEGTAGTIERSVDDGIITREGSFEKDGQTLETEVIRDGDGPKRSFETGEGAQGITTGRGDNRTTVGQSSSSDYYAAHDGHVYKQTDSGWSHREDGDWQNVDRPARSVNRSPSTNRSTSQTYDNSWYQAQLDRDYTARQRSTSSVNSRSNRSPQMSRRRRGVRRR